LIDPRVALQVWQLEPADLPAFHALEASDLVRLEALKRYEFVEAALLLHHPTSSSFLDELRRPSPRSTVPGLAMASDCNKHIAQTDHSYYTGCTAIDGHISVSCADIRGKTAPGEDVY
jgi:hypothetical protein